MVLHVKNSYVWLVLVVALCWLTSCSTDEKNAIYLPEYGQEFVPLALNQYRDYRIDTLAYNKLQPVPLDSGHVYQRRILKKVLKDTTLYKALEVEVWQRTDTTQPWLYRKTDVEYVRFDGAYLVQEAGIKKQLLSYPFSAGTRWNINAFNADAQIAGYTLKFSTLSADSVASFVGDLDSTCLGSHHERVSFKKNVGLVYRYSYATTFVDDPLNPCAQPVVYQTRKILKWTFLRLGTL